MVITLKGADFSASNIGTLSTWRIIHSLDSGATYDGPISIDKGARLDATISVAEGYELGSEGIVVTMNEEVLSNAVFTTDGQTWSIIIPEVIDDVIIKVSTVTKNQQINLMEE